MFRAFSHPENYFTPENRYSYSNYRVFLGEYELNSYNPNVYSSTIKKVVINSNYSGEATSGDIALVELNSLVTFTPFIIPVCLPSPQVNFPNGMGCWVTGWGDIQSGQDLPNPKILQEVQIPLIDAASCDILYHIDSMVSPTIKEVQGDMICAGYPEGKKDSCQVKLLIVPWVGEMVKNGMNPCLLRPKQIATDVIIPL
ncbi:hypothetical protein NDU88_004278 [Pleurodeles waltl]|uniref:Peptidase S1 domain-containing protein n=1 Tax=Pleurodeles waltl TaxID=8319 RepID=A0AAV7PC11_PLEWA|nr:hypothetical protein NDU88_004278 [Pleurodeles waltl]